MLRYFPLLVPPLASVLLLVDAQLGLYGLYIQWGIAPFRTLLVPAIEIWAAIALLVMFVLRLRRAWPAFSRGARIGVPLLALLLVLPPVALARTHAGFLAEIDAQLVTALQSGRSPRIPIVRYKHPLSAHAFTARRCEVGGFDATGLFHVREVEIACDGQRVSVDVVYLWSTAQMNVRP